MRRVRPHAVRPVSAAADSSHLLRNQEGAILDTTELVCGLMQQVGVDRIELARRMGVSVSRISNMLDGGNSCTIRNVSDVLTHLGFEFRAACVPITQ